MSPFVGFVHAVDPEGFSRGLTCHHDKAVKPAGLYSLNMTEGSLSNGIGVHVRTHQCCSGRSGDD